MVSWRLCCYLETNWLNGMAASWRCRFSSRMSHSLMMRPFDCSIKVSCMVTIFSTGDFMFGGANCLCRLRLLAPALSWLSRIDSYIRQKLFGAVDILDIDSHS